MLGVEILTSSSSSNSFKIFFVIFVVNHNHIREAVVEVESFPKPDFPDLMNNMEMSDMADFDLDFEPNKV